MQNDKGAAMKFIGLRYTFSESSGAVLINVDQISSIDLNNGKVYVTIVGKKFAYPVNHTIQEIIQMIEIAGAEIVKPAKNDQDSEIVLLFKRLIDKYENYYDISRALKAKYPEFYTTDHINGIAQRLKRLENTHDNLDSYPQKKQVLDHLRQLDSSELLEH